MQLVHQPLLLRELLRDKTNVALVATMGNLHEGHLHLVENARKTSKTVVASIFVNPLQFAASDDFDGYPRTLERDCELLAQAGCDIAFAPAIKDMYPTPQTYLVEPDPALDSILEGKSRPGFFRGVCTVVLKLFNLVQPHQAFFGKKDYQQWRVIEKMVEQLSLPIQIHGVDTVREPSGLARSSRNAFLSQQHHQDAAYLYQLISEVAASARKACHEWAELESAARARLAQHPDFHLDYLTIRRQHDLGPPLETERLVVLVAAKLGSIRLLDNVEI